MMQSVRPQRTGTYTSRGQFKTTRQYIGPDGLPVRKEFIQRKRESERAVVIRADKWVSENVGKLPTRTMSLARSIELYIEDRESEEIRVVTLKDDRFVSALLSHALGVVRIDALDAYGIERALRTWREKPRTAKKVRDFGRKLYKWLAKRGWVDDSRNPFTQAKAPTYAPEKWQEPISTEHFETALAKVCAADYRAVLLLLRWTGIRPKSARELMWAEIGEKEGRMWITKQSAKRISGTRPVMVPAAAAENIRALPRTSLFVFPSPKTGKPYSDTTIMAQWRRAQKAAGLTPRELYDLKHMRVTELSRIMNSEEVAVSVGLESSEAIRNNYFQIDRTALAQVIDDAGVNKSMNTKGKNRKKKAI